MQALYKTVFVSTLNQTTSQLWENKNVNEALTVHFVWSLHEFFLAEPCLGASGEEDKVASLLGSHKFKGCTFRVERGDYSGILRKVVENLERAEV